MTSSSSTSVFRGFSANDALDDEAAYLESDFDGNDLVSLLSDEDVTDDDDEDIHYARARRRQLRRASGAFGAEDEQDDRDTDEEDDDDEDDEDDADDGDEAQEGAMELWLQLINDDNETYTNPLFGKRHPLVSRARVREIRKLRAQRDAQEQQLLQQAEDTRTFANPLFRKRAAARKPIHYDDLLRIAHKPYKEIVVINPLYNPKIAAERARLRMALAEPMLSPGEEELVLRNMLDLSLSLEEEGAQPRISPHASNGSNGAPRLSPHGTPPLLGIPAAAGPPSPASSSSTTSSVNRRMQHSKLDADTLLAMHIAAASEDSPPTSPTSQSGTSLSNSAPVTRVSSPVLPNNVATDATDTAPRAMSSSDGFRRPTDPSSIPSASASAPTVANANPTSPLANGAAGRHSVVIVSPFRRVTSQGRLPIGIGGAMAAAPPAPSSTGSASPEGASRRRFSRPVAPVSISQPELIKTTKRSPARAKASSMLEMLRNRRRSTHSSLPSGLVSAVVEDDDSVASEMSETQSHASTSYQVDKANPPRYLLPSQPIVRLQTHDGNPNQLEWDAYWHWLSAVIEAEDIEERPKDIVTPQMLVFLHFYRLEIPVAEIRASFVGTREFWQRQRRLCIRNVSFLSIPLPSSAEIDKSSSDALLYNSSWWSLPTTPYTARVDFSTSYVNVCHRRQTYSVVNRKKRNQSAEKEEFLRALAQGDETTLLAEDDDGSTRDRDTHIRWAVQWITGDRKTVSHSQRVLASQALCKVAFPEERVPGIRRTLFETEALQCILRYARRGEVSLHRRVTAKVVLPERQIARGAVGKVFVGKWRNQKVAIKFCHENTAAFDILEFRFEVAIMCVMSHPNILPCYAANLVGPNYFILSPYQERGTLEDVLQSAEELPMSRILSIAVQIASAMDYMHSIYLMHRDLKSPNILLNNEWHLYITDFGTARVFGKQDKRELEPLVGTTAWMAPEMLQEKKYNEKVDVYSFAIVMSELLTQKPPFDGVKTWDIPDLVIEGKRPELPKKVPTKLRDLVVSCWQANPKKRPTFAAIHEKLKSMQAKIDKL